MNTISKLTGLALLSLIPIIAFPDGRKDIIKTEVIRKGLETKITSEELELTSFFLKPVTVPQSSDAENWKMMAESSVSLSLGGVSGQLNTVSWSLNTGQLDCETWISGENKLVAFRQIYTNKTRKTVRLGSLHPLFIDGKRSFRFGSPSEWHILEQFRHKNDLPKSEIPAAGKTASCDPFFIINNHKGSGQNLFIGYQTFYPHLAEITFSFDTTGNPENISADCDFEGVEVPPGGNRTSQWIIISQGSDANLLIKEYTQRIRTFYNLDKPSENAPSVYCTWYYHATNYNEAIFKNDIAAFRKEHLPFDVFLIDECWDVDKWGDFEANESFPDGMKWVAQQIKSAGYIPGIWTAPFLADKESDLFKNNPEWLLKNSKGEFCTFFMNERDHYILDLTFPGVCEYLEEQFRKISGDWGFRYFKFDFMRAVFLDSGQQFFDQSATSLEAYRRGLEAIRRGTGNDAYISVCGGHYGASLGIADSQRSGSDVKSAWSEKELPKYRQNILRTWMSGLWHVDPDAMMVRRQDKPLPDDTRNLTTGLFTDEEAFTNALNQFIGGNLITFTEDFSAIDEDRKMLYKHVIPSANASSCAIDLFNIRCPEIMVTHIVPRCNNLVPWNMLSVINWTNENKEYQIPLDDKLTGNLNGVKFLVYDFQSRKMIGKLNQGEVLTLESVRGHQSRLLKIIPWDGKSAVFLGTDLNFSCGGNETSEITFGQGKISGKLETSWYVPVTLAFWIPAAEGYKTELINMSPGQKMFFLDY